MRAKAHIEAVETPGTYHRFACRIFCPECPDGIFAPMQVELDDHDREQGIDEIVLQGPCWDSGLKVQECPHLAGMEMAAEDSQVWIICNSPGKAQ